MFRLIVLLSLFPLAGCNSPQAPTEMPPARLVKVAPVHLRIPSRRFVFTATSRATEHAGVASQVGGVIRERPVKLGDHVAKGALLARLQNPEPGPALEAASARLQELRLQHAQAGRDVKRLNELFGKKLVARHELEQAQTRHQALAAAVASAQAAADGARQRVAETTLRAPIAGEIVLISAEPGEFLAAGLSLLEIAGEETEVEFNLPETLLPQVVLGQSVSLSMPLFDERTVQGHITELAESAALTTRLFPVVVSLDTAADLRSGLTLSWALHRKEAPQLMVPLQAIASPAGAAPRVYRVVDNRAKAVPVVPGIIDATEVAVSGALSDGDEVIVAGLNNLADGYPVEIRR